MKLINSETIQPKVGLSACLAGYEVRYDAQHKRSSLCLNELSEHFSFQTFCPEMAAGFGTPRPTMRLTGDPENPDLRYTNPDIEMEKDLGERLREGFLDELDTFTKLDGYILMKNSPSCGMERVKVYQENGHPHQTPGRGLFAAALMERYPLLPVEEEGRLHDAHLYENFVLRVYAHRDFRLEVLTSPSMKSIIDFHSSYKYVLMAQSPKYYKILGNIVANHERLETTQVIENYQLALTEALAKPASRGNHTNTLEHILGYLKKTTSSEARQSIKETIHKYNGGEIPLVVPLTLLKHYIDQHGDTYIRTQRYLQPYPDSMRLRNKI